MVRVGMVRVGTTETWIPFSFALVSATLMKIGKFCLNFVDMVNIMEQIMHSHKDVLLNRTHAISWPYTLHVKINVSDF